MGYTYGYEDPVVMPTMLVYDTDLAKLYIAGIKDQYDKALELMKDFMKLYLDFSSPVEGATEAYYNMTTGGANKLINDLYSQGIDPYKNPHARALVSQYINSVPVATLKLLEQLSSDWKDYLKTARLLDSNGKLNRDFERMKLQDAGILDENGQLKAFKNGEVVNLSGISPSEYLGIEARTQDWYKQAKDRDYGIQNGYRVLGLNDKDALSIAYSGIDSYMSTPEGKFETNIIRDQLSASPEFSQLSKEQQDALVRDAFAEKIRSVNRDKWGVRYEADPFATMRYKQSLEDNSPINRARAALIAEQINTEKAKLEKYRKSGNSSGNLNVSWTEAVDEAAENTYKSGRGSIIDELQQYKQQYLANVKNATKGTKYFKSSQDKEKYKIISTLQTILKKDKFSDSDVKWLKLNKFIGDDGNAGEALYNILDENRYLTILNKAQKASVSTDFNSKVNIADKLFTQNSSTPNDTFQHTARILFFGSEVNSTNNTEINIGSANMQFTPISRMNMFNINYNNASNSKIAQQFSDWLKGERPYALSVNHDVRVSSVINGYRYLSGNVAIRRSDFKKFAELYGLNADDAIKQLGLTSTNKQSTTTKYTGKAGDEKLEYTNVNVSDNYVIIPMTKAVLAGDYEDLQINTSHRGRTVSKKDSFGIPWTSEGYDFDW